MHFRVKNTLKNNRYHNPKHPLIREGWTKFCCGVNKTTKNMGKTVKYLGFFSNFFLSI
jgi:hypothetical protein